MSNDKTNQGSNINTLELSILGELLITLGYAISTVVAIRTLEEEQQERMNKENMQKQIDYLLNEVKHLKTQLNNQR